MFTMTNSVGFMAYPQGENDPYWDYVVFLSHWDAGFVDEKGHTLVQGGTNNPQNPINTTIKKFGNGSLEWGEDGYVRSEVESDFQIPENTDFCLEGWYYATTDAPDSSKALIGLHTSDAFNHYIEMGLILRSFIPGEEGTLQLLYDDGPTNTAKNVLVPNQWQHFAIVRHSTNNIKLYIDGNLVLTSSAWLATDYGGLRLVFLNSMTGLLSFEWPGYIDEVRFTIGHARYTANFTPPIAPFPNS